MGGFGFNRLRSRRGVTLLELLITLVIIFILASVALPITKVSTKRSQELELRQTLRTVRTAIDTFRRDWARDGDTLVGPLCVKNQLTCKESTGYNGYPKSLEQLLRVELTGAEAQVDETHAIRRYLRRIPIDPMTGKDEWGLRCHQDEADEDRWCGEDVFDIYTTSSHVALDKTKYRDW
ncbi:MAG: type II secretion system GspH family protein [Nitrospirales bacterium]|nr:type II secretion system protein [Nitrospira sp.]MDR4502474.1 type II secretion system GspH family protein [Nitrospirales bacterium]